MKCYTIQRHKLTPGIVIDTPTTPGTDKITFGLDNNKVVVYLATTYKLETTDDPDGPVVLNAEVVRVGDQIVLDFERKDSKRILVDATKPFTVISGKAKTVVYTSSEKLVIVEPGSILKFRYENTDMALVTSDWLDPVFIPFNELDAYLASTRVNEGEIL